MKRSSPIVHFVLPVAVLIVGACERGGDSNESPAPVASEPAPSAMESSAPSASSAPGASSAPERRPSSQVAGRVLELKRGDNPSVRIAAERGDLVIKGVDGELLGWRRGDRVLVDGDKNEGEIIDCSDASACSLGLESGGDLVFSSVDAAAASPLLGMMKKRVVVAGPSRRASVELRATSDDLLIRSFAAATGLGFKRYRNLILFAQPKILTEAKLRRVVAKNRRADIQLVHAELSGFAKFLGDILKVSVAGTVEGEVSVSAREIDAADILDAAFGLCAVQHKKSRGALELLASGPACRQRSPERRCPRREGPPSTRAVNESLRCIGPEHLRALAVAIPKEGRPMALLGEGDPTGDEIAAFEGDFLGQSEKVSTPKGDYEVNWRISHIAHAEVELYFGVDPNVGIDVKERRIRIPVATSPPQ